MVLFGMQDVSFDSLSESEIVPLSDHYRDRLARFFIGVHSKAPVKGVELKFYSSCCLQLNSRDFLADVRGKMERFVDELVISPENFDDVMNKLEEMWYPDGPTGGMVV